jgi:hypothetical protein
MSLIPSSQNGMHANYIGHKGRHSGMREPVKETASANALKSTAAEATVSSAADLDRAPVPTTTSLDTGTPTAARGNSDFSALIPVIQGIVSMISSIMQGMSGAGNQQSTQSPFNLPTSNTPSNASTTSPALTASNEVTDPQQAAQGNEPLTQQAPVSNPVSLRGADFKGTLNIAALDDFTGSSHGDNIAKTLENGGGDAGLAGKVNVQKFNISNGSTSQINDSLKQIIAQVKNGGSIDAVNISQQALNSTSDTTLTSQLVDQLAAMDIPVAIAAGNGGPQKHNYLEGNNTFNVSSSTNGQVNASSGEGNVVADGETTSQATANLSPILALRHRLGMTNQEIFNSTS